MPTPSQDLNVFQKLSRLWSSKSQTCHSAVFGLQPERAASTPMSDLRRFSAAYLSRRSSSNLEPSDMGLSDKNLDAFEALIDGISNPAVAAIYQSNPDALTSEALLKYCIAPMLIAEVRRLRAQSEQVAA